LRSGLVRATVTTEDREVGSVNIVLTIAPNKRDILLSDHSQSPP